MVFGIVKQHQGWIECASSRGQGTCFDIYLPRYMAPPEISPGSPTFAAPQSGSETILLVDDEAMIRNLGRTTLERFGYRVLLAEDGVEALDIYTIHKDEINLVVLDLTMPRMSGHDVVQRLVEMNPIIKILLASGYSTEHAAYADRDRIIGFIGKPFRPDDLARLVRAALDKPNENATWKTEIRNPKSNTIDASGSI
jgi:DNA-binding NtrC family response regulator